MTTPKRSAARTSRKTQPRVTRPVLDRDAPDRSPGGYLRANGRRPGMRTAQRVVETSVEGAYRVIQEYLRWGQRSAEQFTSFESKREPMRNHQHDEYDRDPAAQWFEMWQWMYMQWMSMFMGGMMPRPGMWGPPGMGRHGRMETHELELELELEASNRTAKVWLELDHPLWGGGHARLHKHHSDEKLAVEVSERGRIEVHVGEATPNGTYRGEIWSRDGSPCGRMKITLSS